MQRKDGREGILDFKIISLSKKFFLFHIETSSSMFSLYLYVLLILKSSSSLFSEATYHFWYLNSLAPSVAEVHAVADVSLIISERTEVTSASWMCHLGGHTGPGALVQCSVATIFKFLIFFTLGPTNYVASTDRYS